MKKLYILFIIGSLTACSTPVNEDETQNEDAIEVQQDPTTKDEESSNSIDCTGEISVPADAQVSIHSPFNGILKDIKVLEGEQVKKGQILATLEHIDIIKIQENYLTARAQYQLSKTEFERKKELFEQKVVPAKEFQQAEAAYQSNKVVYESLSKQITLLGLSKDQLNSGKISETLAIRSPINGYVTSVDANKGKFVNQDMKIFQLVDDSHKHVHLKVFATDIAKVKEGQKIEFRIAGSDEIYKAEVYLVGKTVESANKAIHVHGHLDNENNDLVIGTAVFGKILLEE